MNERKETLPPLVLENVAIPTRSQASRKITAEAAFKVRWGNSGTGGYLLSSCAGIGQFDRKLDLGVETNLVWVPNSTGHVVSLT